MNATTTILFDLTPPTEAQLRELDLQAEIAGACRMQQL